MSVLSLDMPHVCSVCEGTGLLLPNLSCPLCEGDPEFFQDSGPMDSPNQHEMSSASSASSCDTKQDAASSTDSQEPEQERACPEAMAGFGGLRKGFLLREYSK
jgi:hypothetical protein